MYPCFNTILLLTWVLSRTRCQIPRLGLLHLPKIAGQARTTSAQQFPPCASERSALRSGYQTASFRLFPENTQIYLKIQANAEYEDAHLFHV